MARNRYTKPQMLLLVKKYETDKRIAEAMGVARQTIQKQRVALGVQNVKARKVIRNIQIIRHRNAGWLIRELAEKFNVSERHIKRIIKNG